MSSSAPPLPTSDKTSQLDYINKRPKLLKLANRYCLEPLLRAQETEFWKKWKEAAKEEAKFDEEEQKEDALSDRTMKSKAKYATSLLDRRDIERIRYFFAEEYIQNEYREVWDQVKGYPGTRECKLLLILAKKLGTTTAGYEITELESA